MTSNTYSSLMTAEEPKRLMTSKESAVSSGNAASGYATSWAQLFPGQEHTNRSINRDAKQPSLTSGHRDSNQQIAESSPASRSHAYSSSKYSAYFETSVDSSSQQLNSTLPSHGPALFSSTMITQQRAADGNLNMKASAPGSDSPTDLPHQSKTFTSNLPNRTDISPRLGSRISHSSNATLPPDTSLYSFTRRHGDKTTPNEQSGTANSAGQQQMPSKSVLTVALQKAQSAVLLDSAGNEEAAIAAYVQSVRLLKEVMVRVEESAGFWRLREKDKMQALKERVPAGTEKEKSGTPISNTSLEAHRTSFHNGNEGSKIGTENEDEHKERAKREAKLLKREKMRLDETRRLKVIVSYFGHLLTPVIELIFVTHTFKCASTIRMRRGSGFSPWT